jgi:hypothetical protein
MSTKQKTKIVKDVTQLVLARRTRMCNFLEYKGGSLDLLHVSLEPTPRWKTTKGQADGGAHNTDGQIPKSYIDAMPLYSSSAPSLLGITN